MADHKLKISKEEAVQRLSGLYSRAYDPNPAKDGIIPIAIWVEGLASRNKDASFFEKKVADAKDADTLYRAELARDIFRVMNGQEPEGPSQAKKATAPQEAATKPEEAQAPAPQEAVKKLPITKDEPKLVAVQNQETGEWEETGDEGVELPGADSDLDSLLRDVMAGTKEPGKKIDISPEDEDSGIEEAEEPGASPQEAVRARPAATGGRERLVPAAEVARLKQKGAYRPTKGAPNEFVISMAELNREAVYAMRHKTPPNEFVVYNFESMLMVCNSEGVVYFYEESGKPQIRIEIPGAESLLFDDENGIASAPKGARDFYNRANVALHALTKEQTDKVMRVRAGTIQTGDTGYHVILVE